jgi:hypothetical protein
MISINKLGYVVSEVADSWSIGNSMKMYLDKAVDVCIKTEVQYFLVPGFSHKRHRIGILKKDRDTFFRQLAKDHANSGLYIAPPVSKKTSEVHNSAVLVTDMALPREITSQDTVRIYSFLLAPDKRILSGVANGCDIEFWDDKETFLDTPEFRREVLLRGVSIYNGLDLSESWIAPRRNKVSIIIPKEFQKIVSTEISGQKYKTLEVFEKPRVHDINFPIDIVYTWVDGQDPKWKKKFAKYSSMLKGREANNSSTRYEQIDELKYSLRSIYMFAPWVRNIYIVTDNQVPEWLDTSVPGVQIIDHKDIFEDPSVLPVFNSNAIATQLHRIKGLSEHYVYFNDDVLLGNVVSPEIFFHPSGLPKYILSRFQVMLGEPNDKESVLDFAGKNVRKLLEDKFGQTITAKYAHVPVPKRKSLSKKIKRLWPEEIRRTAASRFRDKSDIAGIGNNYALINGQATTTKYPFTVILPGDNLQDKLEELYHRQPYTFCINSIGRDKDKVILTDFLNKYLPYPSPWEKSEKNEEL